MKDNDEKHYWFLTGIIGFITTYVGLDILLSFGEEQPSFTVGWEHLLTWVGFIILVANWHIRKP